MKSSVECWGCASWLGTVVGLCGAPSAEQGSSLICLPAPPCWRSSVGLRPPVLGALGQHCPGGWAAGQAPALRRASQHAPKSLPAPAPATSHAPCALCHRWRLVNWLQQLTRPASWMAPLVPPLWPLVRSNQVLRGMNMAKSVLYWTLVVGFPCAGWLVLFPTLIYLKWSRRDLQGAASGGIIGG